MKLILWEGEREEGEREVGEGGGGGIGTDAVHSINNSIDDREMAWAHPPADGRIFLPFLPVSAIQIFLNSDR